jgi:hypothetical protein
MSTKTNVVDGKELMICRNGKPMFAVRLVNGTSGTNANYVFVENGDVKFASSWLDSIQGFEVGNESHRLAKEIFTTGLQSAIKIRILELRQLESIFHDIDLADCLGDVIVDNVKRLESHIQEVVEGAVAQEIQSTVRPLALKKHRTAPEEPTDA